MTDNHPIRIDISQIPAVEVQILSATVLKSVQAFYENPENQHRFEEWMAARNKEVANGTKEKRQQGP